MSAFLVENETINKVVSYMLPDNASHADGTTLGAKLLTMNHVALKERYGDKMPESVKFRYKYKSYVGRVRQCIVIKAMRCLRYQCSEGNVPESDLYKQLVKSLHQLALDIVDKLPEYESAESAH